MSKAMTYIKTPISKYGAKAKTPKPTTKPVKAKKPVLDYQLEIIKLRQDIKRCKLLIKQAKLQYKISKMEGTK